MMKVLYVADNSHFAGLTGAWFQKHAPRIEIKTVETESEAATHLTGPEGPAYDAVLIDLEHTNSGGLSLLKFIRGRGLPQAVVFLGEGRDGEAQAALTMGASSYVTKAPGYLYQLPTELENACYRIELVHEKAALYRSEARNRAILEAIPDLMFIQTRDGVYLDYHAADASTLFCPPEKFLGKNMKELMPPHLAERFERTFEDVTKTGRVGVVEYTIPVNGEEHHYKARIVNCDRDNILSIIEDITERKRIEQALRESENRARRALVEQMLVGVAECDRAGRFLLVNRRLCNILGYSETELRGMRVTDVTHPVDLPWIKELYRRLVENGESFVVEARCRRKDGSDVWVSSNVSPAFDSEGKVIHSVAIAIDITSRKKAESEREQLLKQEKAARAEAQAADQSKDQFLAIVSHELRNPLSSILGYARLLQARTDEPETRKMAEIIERNGKMQLQLIEDLLDTARIITGKLTVEVQPVDLVSVVAGAIDVMRPAAQAKGIELCAELAPSTGRITADPSRLQQIVWNLLSNAIKFTSNGGRVDLRTENALHYVRIVVVDTGKGIEPEFLPFVFDRFRQADSSSSRRFGGLGLGLALVKQLVELHGGTISASSGGPGCGATFTVTLPQDSVKLKTFVARQPSSRSVRESKSQKRGPAQSESLP